MRRPPARVAFLAPRPLDPTDRPRWSDLSSALFWLARRGWPALEVAGETIEGETGWRRWCGRVTVGELLAVRDRVADERPATGDPGGPATGDPGAADASRIASEVPA
ncbi:hypothetical protein KF840_23080 [bacterium]|nr:hypothetical protein [bacterium]